MRNKVYQIALHHDEPIVEKIGWNGITSPYVAMYGKPTLDKSSEKAWTDDCTLINIKSTGSTIVVYFTDKDLETEVKRAERN